MKKESHRRKKEGRIMREHWESYVMTKVCTKAQILI